MEQFTRFMIELLEEFKDYKLPTAYQQFIHLGHYARYNEEKGRRETWPETVYRYVEYIAEHTKERCNYTLSESLLREIYIAILHCDVLPSMRCLMTAGKALKANEVASYNCSALYINCIDAFAETMYILMSGAGVGFSVERQFINQLPSLPDELKDSDLVITVEDSREGWAAALKQLIENLYRGHIFKWDLSKLRPAGAKLKVFGGRSSGPGPLGDLFHYVISIFKEAVSKDQKKLTSIQCHSIVCKIGDVVVSGGVRRSSLISLSNPSDDRMRHAKSGNWFDINPHFSLANNSAVWTEKPDAEIFLREWIALMESKSGERGIFNRTAAQEKCKKIGRDSNRDYLCNPCQPSGATLLTPYGIRTLGECRIGDMIWSGQRWTRIVNIKNTGIKPVYEYHTRAGIFVGTENHRVVSNGQKIEVKDATSISISLGEVPSIKELYSQDIMDGLVLGDGTCHAASNNRVVLCIGEEDSDYFHSQVRYLIGKKSSINSSAWEVETRLKELPRTYERRVPDEFRFGDARKVCGFLRGIYSANGSIVRNRITLKASSFTIISAVQEMLSSLGIKSYYTVNKAHDVEFNNGTYTCRESYDLNIGTVEGRRIFSRLIGFIHKDKTDRLRETLDEFQLPKKNQKMEFEIVEVKSLGELEVFDITVDDVEHTYWTGGLLVSNCGEIILRDQEFCNLTEVVLRPEDEYEDIQRKVELATTLGTIQSTITNFKYLRPEWKKNCDEERLLGVSFTGIYDSYLMSYNRPGLYSRLEELEKIVRLKNIEWAARLGINPSKARTCVKPAGTTSQLANASSGIHPRYSQFYIRAVRLAKNDPLAIMLMDKRWPSEEDRQNSATQVFYFPVKSPQTYIGNTRKDVSALDHLNLWYAYSEFWADHNPSATIYVRSNEWIEVGNWVYNHFEKILGLTFFPYSDHIYQQAPYREITEQEYNEAVSKLPEIDFDDLEEYESSDNTTVTNELACVAGSCEL